MISSVKEDNLKEKPIYSVVIPVYNSVATHQLIYSRLERTFEEIRASWELLFVDDFSTNVDTWPSLKNLAAQKENVTIIRLMRNFGRGAAVLCGMANAKGDYVVTMDDDLQHRPEDIPKLIRHQVHDVVVGEFKKKRHSLGKRMTSAVKSWVDYIALKKPRNVKLGSFVLMHRRVADAMLTVRTSSPFFAALLFYVSRDVVMVPVHHDARVHGKSSFSTWRRLKQFSILLINNSTLIPRFLAILGGLIFLFSSTASLYLIIRYLSGTQSVPGWGSLMVVTMMLGGTIILGIGILGEYLGRIFANIELRPPYLIREIVPGSKSNTDSSRI